MQSKALAAGNEDVQGTRRARLHERTYSTRKGVRFIIQAIVCSGGYVLRLIAPNSSKQNLYRPLTCNWIHSFPRIGLKYKNIYFVLLTTIN